MMESNAICLVYFQDMLEDNSTPHFGILFDNNFILCLCCGGWLDKEDYRILKRYDGFDYLDDTLKQYFDTDS